MVTSLDEKGGEELHNLVDNLTDVQEEKSIHNLVGHLTDHNHKHDKKKVKKSVNMLKNLGDKMKKECIPKYKMLA